jgi:hypothetical protein
LAAYLDNLIPSGVEPNVDQVKVMVEVCASVHAEWPTH